MALLHSPRIATDGLILCLDAANRQSYPGSGTVWRDLAGSNNGTLTNGPTFNSANAGSIVFDGADDEVLINNNTIARIGTVNHTITAWVNNDIVTEEDFIGTNGISQGDVLLMIFSRAGSGAGGFRGHVWSSTGSSNTIDSPRAIGTGNWSMLTQRVTWGGNIDLFENGVLTATQALVGSAPTSSKTQMVIGCRFSGGGSSHFDGKIANVLIYNRALTPQEILQNYNATKGRFNL